MVVENLHCQKKHGKLSPVLNAKVDILPMLNIRHSRVRGNPGVLAGLLVKSWIPACAGMTLFEGFELKS